MTRRMILSMVVAIAVLITSSALTACGKSSDEPEPPDILYGQDLCAQCGMVIDEPRFAAASLLTTGEVLKFDDVGEMLIYHMNHPEKQAQAWFAHDYSTEEWFRGENGTYVMADSIQTPMGTRIVAFKDKIIAEQFAKEENGSVYTFDEIRAKVHLDEHG